MNNSEHNSSTRSRSINPHILFVAISILWSVGAIGLLYLLVTTQDYGGMMCIVFAMVISLPVMRTGIKAIMKEMEGDYGS